MNLKDLLDEIDRLKAEIDALRPIDKERETRIWQKFRLDWNFHSNHLEGNSLTYGETKSFLLHGITAAGKPLKDHLDIRGHNEALLELTEIIREERPLTEALIRQLHKTILPEPYDTPAQTPEGLPTTKHVVPGRYKTSPNHVKTVTGEMFYFASPEETPAKMEELMNWFRAAKDDKSIHPLILAAEFHYRFIRIHPFDDGNGRIARILMNLILMMKGFPPVIIKTEKKEDYFRALRQADGGDIKAFVIYIGEQLVRSMELFERGAKGEDIEEEDDIEKEILLLKNEIKTKENFLFETSGKKTLLDISEKNIEPFFNELAEKLSQFSDLFRYTSSIMKSGNLIHERSGIAIRSRPIREVIMNDPIKEFTIKFIFHSFKLLPEKQLEEIISVKISPTDYTMTFNIEGILPTKKSIDVALSTQEKKSIINSILRDVMMKIEAFKNGAQ